MDRRGVASSPTSSCFCKEADGLIPQIDQLAYVQAPKGIALGYKHLEALSDVERREKLNQQMMARAHQKAIACDRLEKAAAARQAVLCEVKDAGVYAWTSEQSMKVELQAAESRAYTAQAAASKLSEETHGARTLVEGLRQDVDR